MRNVKCKTLLRVALWRNQTFISAQSCSWVGPHIDKACTCNLFRTETVSLSPWRTDGTYDVVTCACNNGVPWPHEDFQKWLVWSFWMYLQGSHQLTPKTTEPVVQCIRLDTGPNKGIGVISLIFPLAFCSTQTVITTFNLCASLVPCNAVKCKARTDLTFFDEPMPLIFHLSCGINAKLLFLPFLTAEITLEHPPAHWKSHRKCWDLACTVC